MNNTPISQLIKQLFENRIIERRNIYLVHLMKYLSNPNVLNKDDQFGNKIKKKNIIFPLISFSNYFSHLMIALMMTKSTLSITDSVRNNKK